MAYNPVKVRFTFTLKNFHKRFVKNQKAKGVPKEEIISYKKYREILIDFWGIVVKKVLNDNIVFVMPYTNSSFHIKVIKYDIKKIRKRSIDYHLSKKYHKVIRHLNTHSFGNIYSFHWNKIYSFFANKIYYSFSLTNSKVAFSRGVGRKAMSFTIKQNSFDHSKKYIAKL